PGVVMQRQRNRFGVTHLSGEFRIVSQKVSLRGRSGSGQQCCRQAQGCGQQALRKSRLHDVQAIGTRRSTNKPAQRLFWNICFEARVAAIAARLHGSGNGPDLMPADQKSMPAGAAGAVAVSSFGISATDASVVRSRPAMDAAFCKAVRVTLVGSTTPISTRSPSWPVAAL